MKKFKNSFMTLLLMLPLVAGLFTFSGQALAEEVDSMNVPESVDLILHKRIFRELRWKPVEDQVKEWSYQGNGTILGNSEEESQSNPFNGAIFRIWDATSWLIEAQETAQKNGEEFDADDLVTEVSKMSNTKAQEVAEKEGLPELFADQELVTADDTTGNLGKGILRLPELPVRDEQSEGFKAYLVSEVGVTDDKAMNVDVLQKSRPLLVVLPLAVGGEFLTEIHVYPKNVGYVRDPYFYKFGESANGKGDLGPIEGAEFVIYREVDGEKRYLKMGDTSDLTNEWVEAVNEDPLNDGQIDKFVSDENGLVNSGARFLPSGIFYFEEVKAAKGYEIQDKDRAIKIEVPTSWDDPVLINGQEMLEYFDGQVPEEAQETQMPRVYNLKTEVEEEKEVEKEKEAIDNAPTVPSDNNRPTLPNAGDTEKPSIMLPKTGAIKTSLSVVGLMIVAIAGLLLIRTRKERS